MQVAGIVGHKLGDPAGRNLRDEVVDLLIVGSGPQRFHDLPVISLFLQFHFASRGFERKPCDLCRNRVG